MHIGARDIRKARSRTAPAQHDSTLPCCRALSRCSWTVANTNVTIGFVFSVAIVRRRDQREGLPYVDVIKEKAYRT